MQKVRKQKKNSPKVRKKKIFERKKVISWVLYFLYIASSIIAFLYKKYHISNIYLFIFFEKDTHTKETYHHLNKATHDSGGY